MRIPFYCILMVTVATLLGCGDPVREERIDELGPESPGVPEGPFHRAGQPCNDCHAEEGNAVAFSLSGTVYQYKEETLPLADAVVRVIDSRGRQHVTATNCVGNFYVLPGDFTPTYPLRVSVIFGGFEAEMLSFVHRDGSCASCHAGEAGARSVGRVYLLPERGGALSYEFPPVQCP